MERRIAAILLSDMVGYSRLIGLDEEGGRTCDSSAARLAALMDDPPGADCLAFNIGQQRVIQTETARETRRLLDGVDRNRDDLGAGGMDFGKT